MNLQRLLASAVLIGLCAAGTAQAFTKESNIGDQYPYLGRSIRGLGMGNAVLTLPGRNTTDMFYNPATLHDLPKHWEFQAANLSAAINRSLISTVKDVFNLVDDLDTSGTQQNDLDVFQTFFNNHVGQFHSVELGLPLAAGGRKGWGAALILDSRTTISMRNRAFPNFEIRTRSDGGVAFGKSIGLLGDDLVVGALIKALYRVERDKVITTSDVMDSSVGSDFSWSQWGKAIGIGGDLGVRWKLPFLYEFRPVVAVTYQDVGNTRFFGSDTSDNRQSINAAIGFQPEIGEFDLFIEAGASQLTDKMALLSRLHAGAELQFPRFGPLQLSVRGGTNQGYAAGGFTVDLAKFYIDGAFYGEETGEKTRRGASYKYAVGLGAKF